MGFLNRFRKTALLAKGAVEEHAEAIDKGIDKVAQVVDGKTGKKHTDKITSATQRAHGLVEKLDKDKK